MSITCGSWSALFLAVGRRAERSKSATISCFRWEDGIQAYRIIREPLENTEDRSSLREKAAVIVIVETRIKPPLLLFVIRR